MQEAHYDWIKALCAGLPDYAYVGVGRNDGKTEGEFSAVFYKKEKFALLDAGSFWLSETPDVPGVKGWDAACVRICSYARLQETDAGRQFVHFNTHLDHRGVVAMQKGAELVAEKAEEICPDLPAFFTGDFNVTPDKYDEPPAIIDYCFVKGDVQVRSYRVLRDAYPGGLYPSDHFPVLVEVELPSA